MAGAERLRHVFEWSRGMKRLGTTALNNCSSGSDVIVVAAFTAYNII